MTFDERKSDIYQIAITDTNSYERNLFCIIIVQTTIALSFKDLMRPKFFIPENVNLKWLVLITIFVSVFSFNGNAGRAGLHKPSLFQNESVIKAQSSGFAKSLKIHQNLIPYFYKYHLNCNNCYSFNLTVNFDQLLAVQFDVIGTTLNSFANNTPKFHRIKIPVITEEDYNASFLG